MKAVLRKEKALKNQEKFQIKQPEPCLLVAAIEKSNDYYIYKFSFYENEKKNLD